VLRCCEYLGLPTVRSHASYLNLRRVVNSCFSASFSDTGWTRLAQLRKTSVVYKKWVEQSARDADAVPEAVEAEAVEIQRDLAGEAAAKRSRKTSCKENGKPKRGKQAKGGNGKKQATGGDDYEFRYWLDDLIHVIESPSALPNQTQLDASSKAFLYSIGLEFAWASKVTVAGKARNFQSKLFNMI
jgi:hypothetical protein